MNRKAWFAVAIVAIVVAAAVAIAVAFRFWGPGAGLQEKPAQALKLTLGMSWTPGNANVFIAKQMGYFRDEGLEVSLERYASAPITLADLLKGKLDCAIVSETPLALAVLRGERFYVLATTYESPEVTVMIARRDRGITKPSDLAGKRLGTVFGSNGEFVQDTILALNKIDPKSIVRVNLTQAQVGDALIAGEVDAVTARPPYSDELQRRLGESAAVFSAKAIHTTSYHLVVRTGLVNEHPEALRPLLAALLRAGAFAQADPVRAIRTLVQAAGLDEALVTRGMNPRDLTVALGQSLITNMEDRARWAIGRRLVETARMPDFLEWIHVEALAALKPEAVGLVK